VEDLAEVCSVPMCQDMVRLIRAIETDGSELPGLPRDAAPSGLSCEPQPERTCGGLGVRADAH
jgi:hypothetical protein